MLLSHSTRLSALADIGAFLLAVGSGLGLLTVVMFALATHYGVSPEDENFAQVVTFGIAAVHTMFSDLLQLVTNS